MLVLHSHLWFMADYPNPVFNLNPYRLLYKCDVKITDADLLCSCTGGGKLLFVNLVFNLYLLQHGIQICVMVLSNIFFSDISRAGN